MGGGRVFAAVISAALIFSSPGSAQDGTWPIIAGPEAETAYQAMNELVTAGPVCGLGLDVQASAGAIASMEALAEAPDVHTALVAGDVLDYLQSYAGIDPKIATTIANVELALPVFSSELHVLARPDVDGIADLADRPVALGDLSGATFLTATITLEFLGVTPSDRELVPFDEGLALFKAGEVDAVFLVDGVPSQRIADAGLTPDEAQLLAVADPFLLESYSAARIPDGAYGLADGDIDTIAVRQFLVTDVDPDNDEQGCAAVADLVAFIARNAGELADDGHPKWADMDPDAELFDWTWSQCAAQGLRADHTLTCQ